MGALKRQQKDPYRAKAYFEAAQSLKNYPKVLIVLNFGYCYYWSWIFILIIDFPEGYVWSRSYVNWWNWEGGTDNSQPTFLRKNTYIHNNIVFPFQIAERIDAILQTGALPELEASHVDEHTLAVKLLMTVHGIGPSSAEYAKTAHDSRCM